MSTGTQVAARPQNGYGKFHYNFAARPRKEMLASGKRVLTPKFNIEACTDMNGDRVFIVRFKGGVVTLIPAQLTRQAARDKAAHHWYVMRHPERYAHIPCPF